MAMRCNTRYQGSCLTTPEYGRIFRRCFVHKFLHVLSLLDSLTHPQVSFWALTFVEAPTAAAGTASAPVPGAGAGAGAGAGSNGSGLLPAVASSPHAPWLLNPLPAQATLTFNVHANGAVRDCAAHHALGIAVSVANDGYGMRKTIDQNEIIKWTGVCEEVLCIEIYEFASIYPESNRFARSALASYVFFRADFPPSLRSTRCVAVAFCAPFSCPRRRYSASA
jgi:hypothetical protein